MADIDVNQMMFAHQHRSGGGDLSMGASAGSAQVFNGAFNGTSPSWESMQKKTGRAFEMIAKLFEATQGMASSVTLQNLGLFGPNMQLPAGFINTAKKIQTLSKTQ